MKKNIEKFSPISAKNIVVSAKKINGRVNVVMGGIKISSEKSAIRKNN